MQGAKGYWGFPIETHLHSQALETVQLIRTNAAAEAGRLSERAAEVVMKLTQKGLFAYYEKPTQIVPLSPVMRKTADAGIRAVMGALNMVIKQFFKKRTADELIALAQYIEGMLWAHPIDGQPYLVFKLDAALHERALALIAQVREDRNRKAYIDNVIDALWELVDHGVNYYYEAPTELVDMGGMTRKTADFGIKTAEKGIRALIDKLVRELSYAQLVELSSHIESMIHAHDHSH
ncbi:MAG: hypothetical protein H7A00_07780 [Hahellaceae bacterium]|nr:hypothetical protein [Hahellaceae bacterium]